MRIIWQSSAALPGHTRDFMTAQTLTSPQPKQKLVIATEGFPEPIFVGALNVRCGIIAEIDLRVGTSPTPTVQQMS